MPHREKTLEALAKKAGVISEKMALVGFDGFVDKVVVPVRKRYGAGNEFDPIETIAEFGERITEASGKGTNIELVTRDYRLGGNGPNVASGLLKTGMKVRYIGALGIPVHAIFEDFAKKTEAISVAYPGETQALEFKDGKIMFNSAAHLDTITYDQLLSVAGEGRLLDYFLRADLIVLCNWTMILHMTSIFNSLINTVLPTVGPREDRVFLFDLSDPAKRTEGDLKSGLETIRRFQSHGHVILSLNLREAVQVAKVLGSKVGIDENPKGLEAMAGGIRQALDLGSVVVHGIKYAASAGKQESVSVVGPYEENPQITTGAGDCFNAGYATGHLLGLSSEACLTLGVAFSGYYVRYRVGPSLNDASTFISSWK